MKDLNYYKTYIQEKRKQTDFRDFLMGVASFFPVVFHRNNNLISRYPEKSCIKGVISVEEFEKQRDTLCENYHDYDNGKTFFENFASLMKKTHLPNVLTYGGVENSDYADTTFNTRNTYLSFSSICDNENIFYSCLVRDNCSDIFNSIMAWDTSSHVYFGFGIINSYKIYYSKYIFDSNNIWFSSNLIGCSECILCDGLSNQKYCIKNQQFDEQEYFKQKKKILSKKESFLDLYKDVNDTGNNFSSNDSQGNFIVKSQYVTNGNLVYQVNNGRNLFMAGSAKGSEYLYDIFVGGSNISSHLYGCSNVGTSENIYVCESVGMSSNIFYSFFLQDCSYCLGCIGLKNKQYCIFNKQYSKQDWYKKVDEIFSKMESDGTLGDFFPGKINPFYFNDTMAGLIGGFSKSQIKEKGYMWRDEKIKVDISNKSDVIGVSDLHSYQGFSQDGKWKINPDILNKVIVDSKGDYYRIVKMEYDFLLKHGLPLPEIHWMDRMKANLGVVD